MSGTRAPETTAMLALAYELAAVPPEPYVSPRQEHDRTGESLFSANGEEWVRVVGDEITLLSVASAIDPSPQLLKSLHDRVVNGCNFPSWGRAGNLPTDNMDLACGHMARAVAIAWDWHPDLWTPADRALILKTITDRAGTLLTGLYGKGYWARGFTDNHNHVNVTGLAWCGAAFYKDIPQAPEWLAAARLDYISVGKYYNADGSSSEGVPYWSYGMTFILQYIEGLRPLTDSATLYDAPFLRHAASFRLNVSTCGLGGTLPWGDAPSRDYEGPQHILDRLANQYGDSSAAWLSHNLPWAIDGSDVLAWAALWRCAPGPMPALPMDYHLPVDDIVTTRSGWGPGDYLLVVKSGFTNRNHTHLDAGALALAFGSRWLLTAPGYGLGKTSDEYWDGNGKRWTFYANATESHCTLLIDGKNQRFDHDARGTIDRFLSMPQASYTGVDLTQAYAGVQGVRREVFHRRGDYILVMDSVASRQPASVEWLAQFPMDPAVDGPALLAKGERGAIRVQTLLPAGPMAPRKPTSPHVDVLPQNLHTFEAKAAGTLVDFTVLIQPGFPGSPVAPLIATTAAPRPGLSQVTLQGPGWTDLITRTDANDATDMGLPIPGSRGAITATAHMVAMRTDAGAMSSCVAVQASALEVPGVIRIKTHAPAELSLQKTPDGSWIVDASEDLATEAVLPAEMSLQALQPASAGTFRYLLSRGGANPKAATDWLASLLVFREKAPLPVRAPALQTPLPPSITIAFQAAGFQGQQDGEAETVEGKPGTTGRSLRGFGNDAPENAIDWQFTVARPGKYQLTIRYTTAIPEVRMSALLDGALPSDDFTKIVLPGTGGWSIHEDNWKSAVLCDPRGKPLVFDLSEGKHELRLANPSAAVNLDRFEFQGTN